MSSRPGRVPSLEPRGRQRPSARGGRGGLPSLDDSRRDNAREAWRQFARAAGARDLDRGRAASNNGLMWLVVVALGAGAVLWMTGDDQRPTRRHVSPASAPRIAQTPTPGIAPETRTDDPTPDVMALPAAPDTVDPSSTATPDTSPRPSEGEPEATAPRPAPRLSPRNDVRSPSDGWSGPKNPRAPPPGTPEAHAEALRRLPVGRADRPPVAGVGPMGLHVDRVAIGSMYDAGKCAGHETGFSATRHDRVSVCFRVVHPRTTQRVTVLWQRDGETMRRTKMTIPSAHAYRTRAFIVLREGDAGRWNVRIMSTDGIELARAGFDVAA